MRLSATVFALILLMAGGSFASPGAGTRLHTLFAEDWEFSLAENPMLATSVGDHRANDRLASMTRADLDRRAEHDRQMLSRLLAIDRAGLSDVDRVSYDVFKWQLEDKI